MQSALSAPSAAVVWRRPWSRGYGRGRDAGSRSPMSGLPAAQILLPRPSRASVSVLGYAVRKGLDKLVQALDHEGWWRAFASLRPRQLLAAVGGVGDCLKGGAQRRSPGGTAGIPSSRESATNAHPAEQACRTAVYAPLTS